MSLSAYKLFITIAEQKNLTNAAKLLHITPSAASHSISSLERSWGFALFTRDRKGAKLTKNGEMILPRIRAILAENERLGEDIAQINGVEKGTVHLGVLNSVCTYWLPGILHEFQAQYPHIMIGIYQESYQAIENLLADGLIDIGFVSLPTLGSFSTITLLHDRLLCVTPQGYVTENKEYITVEELRRQPLFLSRRGFDRNIEEFIRVNGLELSPHFHITLESSVITLVASGLGCSILPELILQGAPGKYAVYPLENNVYRTLALATLKGHPPSPACCKMIQTIQNYVEKVSQKKPGRA